MAHNLEIKSDKVEARVLFENDPPSIIDFLSQYNTQLYHGHLNPKYFTSIANARKSQLIGMLANLSRFDSKSLDILRFCLHLMQVSGESDWNFPILVNNCVGLHIETGNNRIFADYMMHKEPWNRISALVLTKKNNLPQGVLSDPCLIDNDTELNSILKQKYDKDNHGRDFYLNIKINGRDEKKLPKLEYIGDGTYYPASPESGDRWLRRYQKWWDQYHNNRSLSVYTNWPDLIKNSGNFWEYQIVGPSPVVADERPAYCEQSAVKYHITPTLSSDHVLWILSPRKIDLGDLLFWIDTAHSTYIGKDFDFVLYRRQPEYLSTFIGLPHMTS